MRRNKKAVKVAIDDQKMMDDLAIILLEDAIDGNSDEALDHLEKWMIPTGGPPIPWKGIVLQARELKAQGKDINCIFEERRYNPRLLPMVI